MAEKMRDQASFRFPLRASVTFPLRASFKGLLSVDASICKHCLQSLQESLGP